MPLFCIVHHHCKSTSNPLSPSSISPLVLQLPNVYTQDSPETGPTDSQQMLYWVMCWLPASLKLQQALEKVCSLSWVCLWHLQGNLYQWVKHPNLWVLKLKWQSECYDLWTKEGLTACTCAQYWAKFICFVWQSSSSSVKFKPMFSSRDS